MELQKFRVTLETGIYLEVFAVPGTPIGRVQESLNRALGLWVHEAKIVPLEITGGTTPPKKTGGKK